MQAVRWRGLWLRLGRRLPLRPPTHLQWLQVLHEILTELDIGAFTIKLNHRALLDGVMAIAGVPAAKFRPICSAIDKLDKEPWPEVRREMVEDKGLQVRSCS